MFIGGNPYDGMSGEEVYSFVGSGLRMPRKSAFTSELWVFLATADDIFEDFRDGHILYIHITP